MKFLCVHNITQRNTLYKLLILCTGTRYTGSALQDFCNACTFTRNDKKAYFFSYRKCPTATTARFLSTAKSRESILLRVSFKFKVSLTLTVLLKMLTDVLNFCSDHFFMLELYRDIFSMYV
jgi:hypothetical protein